jgi:hypothetical protein
LGGGHDPYPFSPVQCQGMCGEEEEEDLILSERLPVRDGDWVLRIPVRIRLTWVVTQRFYYTNFSLREIKLGMFLGIREGNWRVYRNSANSVLAHKWKLLYLIQSRHSIVPTTKISCKQKKCWVADCRDILVLLSRLPIPGSNTFYPSPEKKEKRSAGGQ